MLLGWLSSSWAVDTSMEYFYDAVYDGDCVFDCVMSRACPLRGDQTLFGFADPSGGLLTSMWRTSDGVLSAEIHARPWHTREVGDGQHVFFSGVCAGAGSCLEHVTGATLLSDAPKTLTVSCPPFQYALAANYRLVGDVDNLRVWRFNRNGLFVPTGWTVSADGPADDVWSLEVEVTCAPWEAAELTILAPLDEKVQVETSQSYPTSDGSFDTEVYFGGYLAPSTAPYFETELLPLSLGATLPVDIPLGLAGTFSPVDYVFYFVGDDLVKTTVAALRAHNTDPTYDAAQPPAALQGIVQYVSPTARSEFERAAYCQISSGDPSWWVNIRAEIMFGTSSDGGGMIWLPGSGPVPIDPWGPLSDIDERLPVAVATYTDAATRDSRVVEVGNALDAAGVAWSVVDDLSSTTARGDEVVMFAPTFRGANADDSEIQAIDWLSANRDVVDQLDHPTLVFLRAGGGGETHLYATWEGGDSDVVPSKPATCGCAHATGAASSPMVLAWLFVRRRRSLRWGARA